MKANHPSGEVRSTALCGSAQCIGSIEIALNVSSSGQIRPTSLGRIPPANPIRQPYARYSTHTMATKFGRHRPYFGSIRDASGTSFLNSPDSGYTGSRPPSTGSNTGEIMPLPVNVGLAPTKPVAMGPDSATLCAMLSDSCPSLAKLSPPQIVTSGSIPGWI